jgi:hypothetical protein
MLEQATRVVRLALHADPWREDRVVYGSAGRALGLAPSRTCSGGGPLPEGPWRKGIRPHRFSIRRAGGGGRHSQLNGVVHRAGRGSSR